MNFTFFCLVISQYVLLDVYARYNKDVVCIINEDNFPICKTIDTPKRRKSVNNNIPIFEPYLPNAKNGLFFNCSSYQCKHVKVHSITQIAIPNSPLRYCYLESPEKYKCDTLKYLKYKNVDKLLFLTNNLPNKLFYLIDCLAYSDGGRVCHNKDEVDSHAKLVDIGNIARPNEPNALSQEEFICEQNEAKEFICDRDRYVSYPNGLKLKDAVDIDEKILLKINENLIALNYKCIDSWCGYSGRLLPMRRSQRYEPPGGKLYRCYYAKKQQICKELHGNSINVYNARDWLNS